MNTHSWMVNSDGELTSGTKTPFSMTMIIIAIIILTSDHGDQDQTYIRNKDPLLHGAEDLHASRRVQHHLEQEHHLHLHHISSYSHFILFKYPPQYQQYHSYI